MFIHVDMYQSAFTAIFYEMFYYHKLNTNISINAINVMLLWLKDILNIRYKIKIHVYVIYKYVHN